MPQCAHHVASTTLPDCSKVTQVAPRCTKQCVNQLSDSYSQDKHHGTSN